MKLGLANIATVYAVFVMGPGDALLVLSGRVFLIISLWGRQTMGTAPPEIHPWLTQIWSGQSADGAGGRPAGAVWPGISGGGVLRADDDPDLQRRRGGPQLVHAVPAEKAAYQGADLAGQPGGRYLPQFLTAIHVEADPAPDALIPKSIALALPDPRCRVRTALPVFGSAARCSVRGGGSPSSGCPPGSSHHTPPAAPAKMPRRMKLLMSGMGAVLAVLSVMTGLLWSQLQALDRRTVLDEGDEVVQLRDGLVPLPLADGLAGHPHPLPQLLLGQARGPSSRRWTAGPFWTRPMSTAITRSSSRRRSASSAA